MVIAESKRTLLFKELVFCKFCLFFKTLSKNLSANRTNNPPVINPVAGNNHTIYSSSEDKSIEGVSKDQKDAAIITPALNPKIIFSIFLFTFLKKHTISAPNAVIPQVNVAAINA